MEDRKEKNAPWLSVPQFGDWDQKGQVPDYSLDFSKIREMRKQNKTNVSRASLGNEEELIASNTTSGSTGHSEPQHPHYHQTHHSPTVRSLTSFAILCLLTTICGNRWNETVPIINEDNSVTVARIFVIKN